MRSRGTTVWLLPSRRDLRDELVGRHTGRSRQPGLFRDLALETLGDGRRQRFSPRVLGHIEIGLVEGEWLHRGSHRPKEIEHLLRHRAVFCEVWAHDHEIRAQAYRLRHRRR